MTRTDRKILFTALAFFAVVAKGRDTDGADEAAEIPRLAGLAESFCAPKVGSMPYETDTTALDEMIGQHIRQLRDEEETRLPQDREALACTTGCCNGRPGA